MAVVNGYTTVQEVRDQLGDSAGTVTVLAQVERAINATSRAIDDWCSGGANNPTGRRFWKDAAVTTRSFVVDDPYRAWVLDLVGSAGIVVKTDPAGDGSFTQTWTRGTDYQLEPINGGVAAAGDTPAPYAFWEIVAIGTLTFPVFRSGRAGLKVTDQYGWSALPDEANTAAILKTASLFLRKDAPFGVAGFAEFGPVRITRKDADVVELLGAYMKTRSRTLTYAPQAASLFHARSRSWPWPH